MSSSFPVPPLPKPGQQRAYWRVPDSTTALAWAIARAADAHPGPLLAIARDNQAAHQIESDLRTLLGVNSSLPVIPFPDWETLPYDQFSPHPEIVSQRLAALHRLPALKRGVVIVPVQTLLQRLPPVRYVAANTFDVRVGQRLDLDAEKRRLDAAGYRNVPQVLDPGDFAVRGGLLDVFPMGASEPFRVELFDDVIDSIRAFDPESQRSLDKVDAVRLLPGREVPLDEAATQRATTTLRQRDGSAAPRATGLPKAMGEQHDRTAAGIPRFHRKADICRCEAACRGRRMRDKHTHEYGLPGFA